MLGDWRRFLNVRQHRFPLCLRRILMTVRNSNSIEFRLVVRARLRSVPHEVIVETELKYPCDRGRDRNWGRDHSRIRAGKRSSVDRSELGSGVVAPRMAAAPCRRGMGGTHL